MKKFLSALLIAGVFLTGCKDKTAEVQKQDFSNGPVVTEDTETREEKILRMIQKCIEDYNTDEIAHVEDSLKTEIQPMPLELDSLPEITSLNQLTEIKADGSNADYAGTYKIDDKYNVTFYIYHPNGGYFWLNGDVEFTVNPEYIVRDAPEFAEYKAVLDDLLPRAQLIQNYLTGFDVTFEEEATLDGIYHRVLYMNDQAPMSIEQMRAEAESVFDKKFLEDTYYYNAFESQTPVYREVDGVLYCLDSMMTGSPDNQYDTSTIIAAVDNGGKVTINLLTTVMNKTLPYIKEITIISTNNGYRLPSSI